MKAHLRYLRYVVLHKLAVFHAGWCMRHGVSQSIIPWLWRLLVHDWSKFTRAEWTPYVDMFYGEKVGNVKAKKNAFDRAWLHHLHHNPHHWQHWILHEDSGKTFVLIPEAKYVDEMLADWMGAGPKAAILPMAQRVSMTILWYAAAGSRMQLRDVVRARVEEWLMSLAVEYGIKDAAAEIESAKRARESITIPGR